MNRNFDTDRALFEKELGKIVSAPAPISEIRNKTQKRLVARRRTIGVTVFSFLVLVMATTYFPNNAVMAAVRAVFFPSSSNQIIVLPHRPKAELREDMRAISSLSDAQRLLPFTILEPSPASLFKLRSAWISASDSQSIFETLYRTPGGGWVKVTQRSASTKRVDRDKQIDDLLESPSQHRKVGSVIISAVPHQAAIWSERNVRLSRVTITAVGADADKSVNVPLVDRPKIQKPVKVTTGHTLRE